MSQMAVYYASINDTAKGFALSREGIKMAKELNMTSKLPFLYYALGENYKAAGNFMAYGETVETIMALKDSMYAATSAEEKMKMDAQYQLGEKENLILRQKLEIANKNYLIYGSVLLLILAAVLAGLFFTGYKKNQQIKLLTMQAEQKQAEALAVRSAEENERKRISRDLHDNIGAYATVLLANTEQLRKHAATADVKQAVKAVSENAGHIMGSLQETIWVLNNDLIKVTDFIDRFKLYARKMMESYKAVNIIFEEMIMNDIILSPAEAFNIFRILQEALQNVLKHSGSQNITVTVLSNNTFIVSILDDGKGFNTKELSSGNGLYNMQYRAKEAGYTFTISSVPGETAVLLQKNNLLSG
ncbi:MAG: histidine kinase [Ferruginibacter sp.]